MKTISYKIVMAHRITTPSAPLRHDQSIALNRS